MVVVAVVVAVGAVAGVVAGVDRDGAVAVAVTVVGRR